MKDWLPAAGGADKCRAEESGTVRVIDEIYYQKCGLGRRDWGGVLTKRALLGGEGELARSRSLGTRGAGRGGE